MTDVKVPSSGNIRVWWALENAFANFEAPTAAEINASLDISDAISWNDFDFNLSASNEIDDPAITTVGKKIDRGYANFGGSISMYYPRSFDDASSVYSLSYDALDQPRTRGFLVVRIDGKESSPLAAAGDLVHVFRVITDGYAESITGEEAFRYTVSFLPQGDYCVRGVVAGSSAAAVVVTPSTLASSVNDIDRLQATVGGRSYTNGVKWSSSDPTVATVSAAGVVTSVAAGTATVTATYEKNGQTATCAVTVS
jgi:uncharacterized protein YjdB